MFGRARDCRRSDVGLCGTIAAATDEEKEAIERARVSRGVSLKKASRTDAWGASRGEQIRVARIFGASRLPPNVVT